MGGPGQNLYTTFSSASSEALQSPVVDESPEELEEETGTPFWTFWIAILTSRRATLRKEMFCIDKKVTYTPTSLPLSVT